MTERHKTRKNIRIAMIVLLLLLVVGYTSYETERLITGPSIAVSSPANGETVSTSTIEVTGVAKNINAISLDDRNIFIDEKGNFKEELLLSEGYNVITLKANDKFGSETEKTLEVIYKPAMI